MTKEEIIAFLFVSFSLIFLITSIVYYMQCRTIKKLRNKIEELDSIYFDEISAIENIIFQKDSEINRITNKLNQKVLISNDNIK